MGERPKGSGPPATGITVAGSVTYGITDAAFSTSVE